MVIIVVGIVLILAAVAGFFFMQRTKRQLYAMIEAETLTIPELERLRGISDELGARGGFRKTAEVVGAAHPRPEGVLTSEISKTECVWYRYRIDRQYEHVEYRDGKRHYSKRSEKVGEHTSGEGYAIIDEHERTIGVDPNGTSADAPEQTVSRFERHNGAGGRIELFGFNLPNPMGGGGSTIGFEYKEWVIRPGRRLYILGEVHDKIGPLVIAKPEKGGYFIISTRSEDELRAARVKQHKLLAIGVIVVAVAGLVTTGVGIVT